MLIDLLVIALLVVVYLSDRNLRALIQGVRYDLLNVQETMREGLVGELRKLSLMIAESENEIQTLFSQVAAVRGDVVLLQSDREGAILKLNRLAADLSSLERRVVAGKTRLGD